MAKKISKKQDSDQYIASLPAPAPLKTGHTSDHYMVLMVITNISTLDRPIAFALRPGRFGGFEYVDNLRNAAGMDPDFLEQALSMAVRLEVSPKTLDEIVIAADYNDRWVKRHGNN